MEAPDEPSHVGLALHLAAGNGYPRYDALGTHSSVQRLCEVYSAARCSVPGELVSPGVKRRHPADQAPDKDDRPAWDEADGATFTATPNAMPQHPPLYYEAMAVVLRIERALIPGRWSLDREVAFLRLANLLMVAPLPILAWWAARRFGCADDVAIVAALLPFAIPQLTHIAATVNNDNLLILLGAVVTALVGGVVRGDRSTATAIGLGVATGLALLTKVFALFFPVVIAIAYWMGSRRRAGGAARHTAWSRLIVSGAISAGIGAWWYVSNLVSTGNLVPSIADIRLNPSLRPPGFRANPWSFTQDFGGYLVERFWGSFGWYSIQLSLAVVVIATVLAAACVLAAITAPLSPTTSPERKEWVRRRELLAMLVPMAFFGAFVFARAWALHVETGRMQFIQGRYLFGALVGLQIVAAIGLTRLAGAWAIPAATGWAAVMQTDAIRRCLSGWWGGPGIGPYDQLRAMVAWSGWSDVVLAVWALAALAAGAWLSVEMVRMRSRPETSAPNAVAAT
jgi:4-amino-4-deoxy-L-arabinose transferase-like glycosyltransferase